ncbi:MAG TPA: hypothetical protein VFI33_06425, partial [Puia sp.]|nr:hypothetical protein [Puia sp.]
KFLLRKYPEKGDSPAYSLTNNICQIVLRILFRIFPSAHKHYSLFPSISFSAGEQTLFTISFHFEGS